VPIPALIGPSQRRPCNAFDYDVREDHLETCQVKSAASQVHDWVVYRLGDILGWVGHKVKIHKITKRLRPQDLYIQEFIITESCILIAQTR
jgi:hypothetical protein